MYARKDRRITVAVTVVHPVGNCAEHAALAFETLFGDMISDGRTQFGGPNTQEEPSSFLNSYTLLGRAPDGTMESPTRITPLRTTCASTPCRRSSMSARNP